MTPAEKQASRMKVRTAVSQGLLAPVAHPFHNRSRRSRGWRGVRNPHQLLETEETNDRREKTN